MRINAGWKQDGEIDSAIKRYLTNKLRLQERPRTMEY